MTKVTLHLPTEKLKAFESSLTPEVDSKQQVKKIIIKGALSPVPQGTETRSETPVTSTKGRSGLAASANGGLLDLDKSGAPCKKWVKKSRSFKTFTGYSISVKVYKEDKRVKTEKVH